MRSTRLSYRSCILAAVVGRASSAAAADAATAFQSRVMPVLSAHCTNCHGARKAEGQAQPRRPAHAGATACRCETLVSRAGADRIGRRCLRTAESRSPRPNAEAVLSWVRGELTDWLASVQLKEGRGKFRRLSRNEYANTIHDLFGFRPAVLRELPGDGRVDGYDKVSSALPLSSAGAAGFVKITEDILNRMLKPLPPRRRSELSALWPAPANNRPDTSWNSKTGRWSRSIPTPHPARCGPRPPTAQCTYPRGAQFPACIACACRSMPTRPTSRSRSASMRATPPPIRS